MYRSTELGFESLYQFFYARGSQKLVIRESKCSQSVLRNGLRSFLTTVLWQPFYSKGKSEVCVVCMNA